MDVITALGAREGVATFGELITDGVEPRRLGAAVAAGAVARPHRGVYVLPDTFEPFAAAKRLGGRVSHTSAARFHGFDLLEPMASHVTVPRALRKEPLAGVEIHRADLSPHDVMSPWPVTSELRTVLDCLRHLPMRESVVIGDSAVRDGRVGVDEVLVAASRLRGCGSAAARAGAVLLDPKGESALESVGRVEMHLGGLPKPQTQVVIETPLGPRRLDFYFEEQRVGVETDGFATHGLRSGLVSDCVRHNAYALADLLIVRFAWEHVVGMPSFFVSTVELALDLGAARRAPQCHRCGGLVLRAAA